MKRAKKMLFVVRHHRAFQLLITTGITVTTLISIHNPALAIEASILNALTNLIWVWEPKHPDHPDL